MVSIFQIFLVFLKIGAFTFGGGLAMIPVIKREIVDKGWINEDELSDYIAVGQTAPGMIAVNIAILVGIHLKKWKGAIAAVLGVTLPSIIVITLIASFLNEFNTIPLVQSALKGIMLVVIILLAFALYDIGKNAVKTVFLLAYAFFCFAMLYFFSIPTSIIILFSILIGSVHAYVIYRKQVRK